MKHGSRSLSDNLCGSLGIHEARFSKAIHFSDKEMFNKCSQARRSLINSPKSSSKMEARGGVHIEIQGDKDKDFSLRMFRYFYRIFDRHGRQVISIAVLTEKASGTADGRYEQRAFGSGVEFHYLPFNLMDYEREALEADENPMAMIKRLRKESG